MRSITIIMIDPHADASAALASTFKRIEIDTFILEASPQSFDHHVIQPATFAIH